MNPKTGTKRPHLADSSDPRPSRRVKRKADAQPAKTPATFLDLPAELRNQVYEYFFEDLVSSRFEHPWEPLPQASRFYPLGELLLVNRQVEREAGSLFLSDYAHRVTLYFDNATELYDFFTDEWDAWEGRHPVLHNARFCLRADNNDDHEEPAFHLRKYTESVFRLQPGWRSEWDRDHFPNIYQIDVPWLDPSDQKAKMNGFTKFHGSHLTCNNPQTECVPIEGMRFPLLENGCQITSYRYHIMPLVHFEGDFEDPSKPQERACGMLEGRFEDLNLDGFCNEAAEIVLAHFEGEHCGYWQCHICEQHLLGDCDCDAYQHGGLFWDSSDEDSSEEDSESEEGDDEDQDATSD